MYVASVIAGAATPFAFAPVDFSWLALIAVAVLFRVWRDASPRQAFGLGYVFGVGLFGVGVPWVYISMTDFGGVPLLVGMLLTALFVLFLALFPAVTGWIALRFFGRLVVARAGPCLVFPALWVLSEWVRGWFLTGFPWLALGYSQIDTPLVWFAPLAGVYGVSLIAALIAGALACGLRAWRWTAPLILVLVAAGYALRTVEWSTPLGRPMSVALLQGNVSQDVKWRPEQRQPTIELYVRLTRESFGNDLIIWPETALPAFYHQAREFLDELGAEARARGSVLFIGMPVMELETQRYFNSMVAVGQAEQVYSKQHLVPFGEYLPLSSLVGGFLEFMNVPLPDFSVRKSSPLLELAGHQVGVSICYEDVFGEEVIHALPRASLLINASNDAWFGRSFAPHQHLEMARMRAVETGRPMLRVTNTGVTAVIDHRGALQSVAPQFEVKSLVDRVQPMQGETPYVRFGNFPVVIAIMLTLGALRFRRAGSV